ncbi:MAG: hypothetical protein AAGH41_03895 [Pseudomonadota bacterium]
MAKTSKIAALTAALTIAGTVAASASTVTLSRQQPNSTFGTPNLSQQVTITAGIDTAPDTFNAGIFRLVEDDNGILRDILAFCLDPDTTLDLNQAFDTMTTALPWAARLAEIDKLFTSSVAEVDTAAEAAGFQMALWEIIVDSTPGDISTGDFIVSGTAQANAFAADYLSRLAMADMGGFRLTTYVNDGQDLISWEPVPVPAAALLFAPAIGAVMRKKRKA